MNGWIQIPASFTTLIYCVIIGIAMASTIYFMLRRTPFSHAFRRSMVIAFFCAGFLYLVYSERTWFSWFRDDINTYSGYPTEAKTRIFLGPLYDFIKVTREVLRRDSDYVLYAPDDATRLMTQYYLLPRRNRANAKNVIVLYDSDAAYDDRTKTFTKGNVRMENAELLFRYDFGAYVLRIR